MGVGDDTPRGIARTVKLTNGFMLFCLLFALVSVPVNRSHGHPAWELWALLQALCVVCMSLTLLLNARRRYWAAVSCLLSLLLLYFVIGTVVLGRSVGLHWLVAAFPVFPFLLYPKPHSISAVVLATIGTVTCVVLELGAQDGPLIGEAHSAQFENNLLHLRLLNLAALVAFIGYLCRRTTLEAEERLEQERPRWHPGGMSRLLASIALLALVAPASSIADEQPNILLILADDLGFSDLGCYGGEIPTPNLDRLGRDGVRFTSFYNSARCCPSRAALLTGLHPHQAGIGSFAHSPPREKGPTSYRGALHESCVTLAEVLKGAGYGTYMVGKWHVGVPPGPIERGFDEFYGFRRHYEADQWTPEKYVRLPEGREPEAVAKPGEFYATDVFAEYALEFIRQGQESERPWFLYLAHSAPHFPVQAPWATTKELVETYTAGWDVLRERRFEKMKALGLAEESWRLSERSIVPVDPVAEEYSGKPNPVWDSLDADRQLDLAHRMAVFAAMVVHIDRGVGRIIDTLEREGELEDTIILFLSDNGACYEWSPIGFDGPSRRKVHTLHRGEALATMGGPGTYHAYGSAWANLGNTPFRMYKHFTDEGGINTPCIVHWPAGIETGGRWLREPAHLVDLMPTLCEIAGAKYPERRGDHEVIPAEGLSLVPLLSGESLPERDLCFEHQGARAIRRGPWKLVWSKRLPEEIEWKLYDLHGDPCETRDVAAAHPERVEELAEAWEAWARRVGVERF